MSNSTACMQSADESVTSLTADILQRVSSSTELHDTYSIGAHSLGQLQRTPLSPNTPVSSSPATGALPHAVASTLPSTPPLFHHWQSVDELRAQSAEDLKFKDSVFNSNTENVHRNVHRTSANGRTNSGPPRPSSRGNRVSGERVSGSSSGGSGHGSGGGGLNATPPMRMNGGLGDNSAGRSSKRRGLLARNHSRSLTSVPNAAAGAKLTPLHEELHMGCSLEGDGGAGRVGSPPLSHQQPTPPISKCALLPSFVVLYYFVVCSFLEWVLFFLFHFRLTVHRNGGVRFVCLELRV